MAVGEMTIDIAAPPEAVLPVLTDYEKYPDILQNMESAEVLHRTAEYVDAQFTLNLVRRVTYTLRLRETAPDGLSWSLIEGPFLSNDGTWTLTRLPDGSTRARYRVEVRVAVFVPRRLADKLVTHSLPAIVTAFKEEAERRHRVSTSVR